MARPELRVVDRESLDAEGAALLAGAVGDAIAERGACHVAFSGGATPLGAFAALASDPSIDWRGVHAWQVDERIAPDGHRDRNSTALLSTLLDPVHLHPSQLHLMPVTEVDVQAAAERYAADLRSECGGVLDVVHLGIGADGHTASWLPGDAVVDDPADVAVTRTTAAGRRRMTLTPPCVNRARRRIFLVSGSEKAVALEAFLAGDPSVPASRVAADSTLVLSSVAPA